MKIQSASKVKNSKLLEILNLENEKTISFSLGKPDRDTIPVEALKKASFSLNQHTNYYQYSSMNNAEIKKNLSQFMKKRGITCKPEQIFMTTGAQQAINLLVTTLHKDRHHAMTTDLMYPGFKQVIERLNVPALSFQACIDGGDSFESVSYDKKISFIYSVTAGNNPTGYSLSAEEISKIAEISIGHTAPVLEDDAYGFTSEKSQNLIYNLSTAKTYYIGTVSKCIAPSLRIGWIIIPEDEIDSFSQLKESFDLNIQNYSHFVLNKVFDLVDMDTHLKKIKRIYSCRREVVLNALKRYMPDYVEYNKPSSGFFIWMRLPTAINSEEMLEYCLCHYNLSYLPGSAFSDQSKYSNCLRLSYSCCDMSKLECGIRYLSHAIQYFYESSRERG